MEEPGLGKQNPPLLRTPGAWDEFSLCLGAGWLLEAQAGSRQASARHLMAALGQAGPGAQLRLRNGFLPASGGIFIRKAGFRGILRPLLLLLFHSRPNIELDTQWVLVNQVWAASPRSPGTDGGGLHRPLFPSKLLSRYSVHLAHPARCPSLGSECPLSPLGAWMEACNQRRAGGSLGGHPVLTMGWPPACPASCGDVHFRARPGPSSSTRWEQMSPGLCVQKEFKDLGLTGAPDL